MERASAAVATLAAVTDAIVTWAVLSAGIGYERNAVMVGLFHSLGVVPALVLGLLLRLGIVAMLYALARQQAQPHAAVVAVLVLLAVALWWVTVDLSNIHALV